MLVVLCMCERICGMLLCCLLKVMMDCGRDFNVVQTVSEIFGGHAQPQGVIVAFNLALLDYGLKDVGFLGSPFTWTNGRIWKRLDR